MLVLHTHIPCNVVCYVAYFTCVVLCRLPFQQASQADVLRRIQENKTKQNIKTSDHQSDIKVTLSNIKNSPEAADSSLKIPDLQKNL